MDDSNQLPNDLNQCHRLLASAALQVAELTDVLDATTESFEKLKQEHAAKLEELAWYKQWVHGRRSERLVEAEGQRHLFELIASDTQDATSSESPRQEIAGHTRRRRRHLDLSHLPHHRHETDLTAEEKICDGCGREKNRIGQDITTVLEHVPSKLEVHQHVRPKYACRYCKDGVASPPPPERPIARSIAGPGLIAQILVNKYGDHLPLYRQEDIFVRHGLHIARSTLCDWVQAAADLLEPLYQLQRKLTIQSSVMWTDDTPINVLTDGEKGSRQGHFWAYIGDDQHPYSVYDFTLSRSRDGPQQFLKGFCGYMHADAYAGYDAIYHGSGDDIVEVACWAHARRRFLDATGSYPRQSHQVLQWIGQLYDIEDRAKPLSDDARCQLRCAESNPVLDKIEAYLEELVLMALPKSSLAKAVNYARNQWDALRCYTTDGRLTIDNNTCERTIRHQAIGRKNWLFIGSEKAGPRAATLFTILAGAKRHRIEPWAYVRELLVRIHADDSHLEELLPDRWAVSHPDAVLTHRLEESRSKAKTKREKRRRRRAQANRKR